MFGLPRAQKRIISLLLDTSFLFIAFWLAFFMRLDSVEPLFNKAYWSIFFGLLPVSLIAFMKLGLYRAVLRYINLHALWAVGIGTASATFTFIILAFFFDANVPRTVPFIFACLCLLFIGGTRIIARSLISRHLYRKREGVMIYGAGAAGRQLANALNQGQEYYVAGFIDDDKSKHKTIVQGIAVCGFESLEALINKKNVKRILLALPSIKRARRKEILADLQTLPLLVQTIPGMADIVEGNAKIAEFKDVEIEDLLGRDPVAPRADLMAKNITNKVVMITGAGGSIGSELCRQIIKLQPKKLVLFELSEFGLYSIDKELNEYKAQHALDIEIVPIVGSVQHINRLETVMMSFNVQTVYHAAAYKHVPLVEHNVVEGVRNNIFGTYYAAKAAVNAKVETFVLISTDKAVRPTNVMGATKRMAELCLQALAKTQSRTRFCMVRFGNVLGSSGSVVPLFRKQIAAGGPVTLTHQDITRYFMTIPEAAQLVIQAGGMGKGGDVFVLDMGDSVKIKDLATKMINLSGYEVLSKANPNGDIEIKCTGLRPGEKLYEELLIGDNVSGTSHERIMTANEIMLEWNEVEALLNKLDTACHDFEHQIIRQILLDAPLGFTPSDGICDLVWLEKKEADKVEPLFKTVS